MKINPTNNISFGMAKFSPAMKNFAQYASESCTTGSHFFQYDTCLRFLSDVLPEKTLDIKTVLKSPRGLKSIFLSDEICDSAYIDGKLAFKITSNKHNTDIDRFIAFTNGLLITIAGKNRPAVPNTKFIGFKIKK